MGKSGQSGTVDRKKASPLLKLRGACPAYETTMPELALAIEYTGPGIHKCTTFRYSFVLPWHHSVIAQLSGRFISDRRYNRYSSYFSQVTLDRLMILQVSFDRNILNMGPQIIKMSSPSGPETAGLNCRYRNSCGFLFSESAFIFLDLSPL